VRAFKTKWFVRYARREKIGDEALREAITRAERGLVDADLGGGLIKLRVARIGQGRSGGYRTLVAYRMKDRSIFLYCFAKNERENIDNDELTTLQEIAEGWLNAGREDLERAVERGVLQEVHYEQEQRT
jgi:hypothetical protein